MLSTSLLCCSVIVVAWSAHICGSERSAPPRFVVPRAPDGRTLPRVDTPPPAHADTVAELPLATAPSLDPASAALVARLPPALQGLLPSGATPAPENAVPKIMHYVYIGDWRSALVRERVPNSVSLFEWRTSCMVRRGG